MTRRAPPVPAYKARLAQRRERLAAVAHLAWLQAELAERMRLEAEADAAVERMAAQIRSRKAELDAKTPPPPPLEPIRPTSFFERLLTAAAETTNRLAREFKPKKGPGDARFFF